MNQIRILIVEDDPFTAMAISTLLENNNFKVIDIVNNAEEAWNVCKTQTPDIVILDVTLQSDIPGTWIGINIKKHNLNTKIIYLTSHHDLETIKDIENSNPALYITKPYRDSTLISNINIIINKPQKTIEIYDNRSIHLLQVDKILYMQSERNYLTIYLHELPKLIIRKKMDDLLKQLPNDLFLKVHQSYAINTQWIEHININYAVILGTEIPISRSNKSLIKKKFNINT